MTLADQAGRDRIRTDLDATLVVEAAAGTGKTSELVGRVIALLRHGKTTLARIVAVTFTEKAAGEMKLRLRAEIERAREGAGTEERRRFDLALTELEEAHIGTIHGFCAELLRQHPIEARVDPLFEAADDDRQGRLSDEAFTAWFERAVADPPTGVRRVLRRRSRDRDQHGPREALRRAGKDLIGQRDFEAAWKRPVYDRERAIDGVVEQLVGLADLAPRALDRDDWCAKSLTEIAGFVAELRAREAIRGRDRDGLEAELSSLARQKWWSWKGRGRWFAKDVRRESVLAQRQAAKDALDACLALLDADLAACLREDLRPFVAAYDELKARAGKLDFLDLLLLARGLVRDDEAVRRELQRRFTHILVDEFQDTDPLQAEILMLLAADDPRETHLEKARPVPGKLFVVGDPKQAIYRFRRADVTLYEKIKRQLLAAGANIVHLTTSFRSAPSLQEAINVAFAARMKGSADGSQAAYVPLSPFRAEPLGQPTLIALPVPRPYSRYDRVTNYAINESLPDAVGAFVEWLVTKSGWTVSERGRPTSRVRIEARHICLLSRRFQGFGEDLMRPYLRALEARRLPHVLVGGRSFHQREEVVAVRNALLSIEWPDDELSVYATLRGPFIALTDASLLAFRHEVGSLHPLRPVDRERLGDLTRPVVEALSVLRTLHFGRNRRPIADTLAELLEVTRAHAGIAIWPTGEQALANVLRVLDLARRFEAAGATSFRAFVEWLEEEADRGTAAEAPVIEDGTDGVRIMTVHRAKGLEFPVVIFVDPTLSQPSEPARYVDTAARLFVTRLAGCTPLELAEHRDEMLAHDLAESVRLTYVAATRARDLLVVPVVADERWPGWVDVMHPVLYPKRRRQPEPAVGCPEFGVDTVVERPVGRDAEEGIMPGAHAPLEGAHTVVWWDPNVLPLGKEEVGGLRQQRILAKDDEGTTAEESERAHTAWRSRRTALLARGQTPSLRVEIASGRSGGPSAPEGSVVVTATTAAGAARPWGRRFGTLVHAILAATPLDASPTQVAAVASVHSEMTGATVPERDAAAEAVVAALAHPLFERARAAGRDCRREAPVLLRDLDGTLLEGFVDLVFRAPDEDGVTWVVVDYKTDREIEGRQAEYEAQVWSYVRAVAAATGERARGVLLRV